MNAATLFSLAAGGMFISILAGLVAALAAMLALFVFFATLVLCTGSWELGPMHERAELASLF